MSVCDNLGWNMLACFAGKRLLSPLSMGVRTSWANHFSSLPVPFDSCGRLRALPRRAASVYSLIHSLTHSLAHSELWSNTFEPIWHWERKSFPCLTSITHEVLIPYDGCQSPAVYISSTPLHPLISLSSFPCDYCYFFSIFKSPRESDGWIPSFFFSWMNGWMERWMQGPRLDGLATWYYCSSRSRGSVLAFTAGHVTGEKNREVICTGLYFHSVTQ